MGAIGIISLLIVMVVFGGKILNYKTPQQRINEMDASDSLVKSDKWYAAHPEAMNNK